MVDDVFRFLNELPRLLGGDSTRAFRIAASRSRVGDVRLLRAR